MGENNKIISMADLMAKRNHRVAPILPAREDVEKITIIEHDSQPIKSASDIGAVLNYFETNEKWRDYMLFAVGINSGLRISDMLELRFSDFINPDFSFKAELTIFEKKTRNTRKKKKLRHIAISEFMVGAIMKYLEHNEDTSLSDYLFKSESNNQTNKAMTRQAAYNTLQNASKQCGLEIRFGTHTLRKTFGYMYMRMNNNEPRAITQLQKMFGHSSIAQTLTYIGITEEEMADGYKELGNYYEQMAKYNIVMSNYIEEVAI